MCRLGIGASCACRVSFSPLACLYHLPGFLSSRCQPHACLPRIPSWCTCRKWISGHTDNEMLGGKTGLCGVTWSYVLLGRSIQCPWGFLQHLLSVPARVFSWSGSEVNLVHMRGCGTFGVVCVLRVSPAPEFKAASPLLEMSVVVFGVHHLWLLLTSRRCLTGQRVKALHRHFVSVVVCV